MHTFLWVLQIVGALVFGASGVMKVFFFDTVSVDVQAFGALPKPVWILLGIIELICIVGLVVPAAFDWRPSLTAVAALVLALESLVFIWVHLQFKEMPPLVMSAALGLLMAFLAYGRFVLRPLA